MNHAGFRIVQAFGAAMMMGIGIAIITEVWPAAQRGKALGIASGCIASGAVVGPVIGGFLMETLGWRWLFLVNIPVGVFSLIIVWRIVPDLAAASQGERFDFAGALTLGGALLCFALALTLGQELGYGDTLILLLFGDSLLLFAVFLWVESRVQHPMIDLQLFGDVSFGMNLVAAIVIFAAISGIMVIMPFYLELVLGVSPSTMGLVLGTLPLAYVITTPLSGTLSDKVGTRPMIGFGMGMMCLSLFLASNLNTDSSLLQFIFYFVPIGIGIGAFNTPNTSAVMGRAPKSQLGVVSGLLSETRTLGQTIGVAALGSFFGFRLQHYAGLGKGVYDASAAHIVQALQDDFLLAAIAVMLCLVGILWVWRGHGEVSVLEAGD